MHLGRRPRLFFSLWRTRATRTLSVSRCTRVVIEGFPRSANTFSVLAFQHAQPERVEVAHHLHVPAQIARAVEWDIPALVLIRNPLDAVASLLVRTPERSASQSLREYISFYEAVAELPSHGYLVAHFDEVVADFGRVIRRFNDRFGTTYRPFEHSPENVTKIFTAADAHETTNGRVVLQAVARPSQSRKAANEAVRSELSRPKYAGLLRGAASVHAAFRAADAPTPHPRPDYAD